MTGRINLNQLRDEPVAFGSAQPVVLALIDAVQAAREIQDNLDRDGYSSAEADQKLRDNLDRFDYGDAK